MSPLWLRSVVLRFFSQTSTQELLSVAAQLHRLNVELRLPSQVSHSEP